MTAKEKFKELYKKLHICDLYKLKHGNTTDNLSNPIPVNPMDSGSDAGPERCKERNMGQPQEGHMDTTCSCFSSGEPCKCNNLPQ